MADRDKTAKIALTPKQLMDLFIAGCEQGGDEATADDWNSRATHTRLEALRNEMVWGSPPILNGDADQREAAWAAIADELKEHAP